jgi:hypothetical protein
MHTEAFAGITAATAGIIMGITGDVAGTLTGGGAPGGGRTTTGAPGATRITGVTPIIMGIILTRRIIMTASVLIMTIDQRATVAVSFSPFQV